MKIVLFSLLAFSLPALAQNNNQPDPHLRQLQEQLQRSQNLFEQFFKDGFFDNVDPQLFGPNNPLFNSPGGVIEHDWARALGGLKTSWKEIEGAKVLVVEGEVSGEDPLDIQVRDGMISLKGVIRKTIDKNGDKSIQQYQFQRSYSIPQGTDYTKMEIKKKDDKVLWLVFPYIPESAQKKTQIDGLKPLKSDKNDPSI